MSGVLFVVVIVVVCGEIYVGAQVHNIQNKLMRGRLITFRIINI